MSKIWISVGANMWETNWKNTEIKWDALVEKLKKPVITKETYAQYIASDKETQSKVKDVGGFVGGVITGGRRRIGSITARYLITLDIDFATMDFPTDVSLLLPNEFVIYSTHKHSENTPRFRLVMPLEREVLADEYEAIARKIAGMLDIELFDPTTFQPERLMFWPSASCDAPFYFMHQKGEFVNPDEILEMYSDWRDSTEWPVSEKSKRKIKEGIDKQEDPTVKGGFIGAFCRSYGIVEAIEKYLPEIYLPTSHDDRYTYAEGSTHGGVIIYDNMFSFSHHSTDPTNNRLCNSFDLVRIHLFGELDANMKEGTPASKRPSFLKMSELMAKDPLIKQTIITEKIKSNSSKDFGVMKLIDKTNADANLDWTAQLDMDKKGNILSTINTIVIILSNDDFLKDNLCYDDLRKCSMLRRDLPWRNITKFTKEWNDSDDSALRNYLELKYGVVNRNNINDALSIVMHQNKFHPVKQYIEAIEWDHRERVERVLIDHLGAEDTLYVREVTRKTLVAAVARIYEPGVKFDNVLVLVGPQGIGKSRIVARLGGEWYSDTFGSLQNKDAMEQLQGVWIMEIGELAGLKKQEVETIKLFISKQEDRFRVAYGKRVETFARQCIFIGTTNERAFLQDPTGNRRFWPVLVGVQAGFERSVHLTKNDVDQIWAEAAVMYTMGEELYLTKEVEELAKGVQEIYTEQDDRKEGIIQYLETPVPNKWYDLNVYDRISYLNGDETIGKPEMVRDFITIPEIWLEHMRGKQNDMTPYNIKFIRNIMNKLPNWEPKMFNRKPYGHQRGWERKVATVAKVADLL